MFQIQALQRRNTMPFMLKIQWDIKSGREADFKANQEKLCQVMLDDHPGVICYHVDYPSDSMSQWVEIYANDKAFVAHLDNEKGKQPLGAVIDACDKITCQCWGNPDDASKEILKGFGATYHQMGQNAFVLNPQADKDSPI
jgi:quinol monooxygenase YgiN